MPPRITLQCSAAPPRTTFSCTAELPREVLHDDRVDYWNAGVAFVSAVLLFSSVVVGARALREQIGAPARERRHQLYHRLVVELAIEEIRKFQSTAAATLRLGVAEIDALRVRDARAKEICDATRRMADAFKVCLEPVYAAVVLSLAAWGDNDLRARVDEALNELEDSVVEGIGLLQRDAPVNPTVIDRLNAGAAAVLRQIGQGEKADASLSASRWWKPNFGKRVPAAS